MLFRYLQFHPLVFLVKLYIELHMADLITKLVRSSAQINPPMDSLDRSTSSKFIKLWPFKYIYDKKPSNPESSALECYGLVAESRHRCARPMPLASARTRARARPNPASPLGSGSVSTLADSFRRVPRDLVVVFPFLLTDLI
jgi:hypothetical protein